MNTNIHINYAFNHFGLDTAGFRTDDEATTRIGQGEGFVVMISDHMQGRGQNVKIKQADKLDVRISTRGRNVKAENVASNDLIEVIDDLVNKLRMW